MNFQDISNIILKAAPTVASLLLGPAAGTATTLLTSIFGGDTKNLDDLAKRITSDPEMQIKLAQLEANNKIELQRLVIQTFGMEIQDKDSARRRETQLAASGHRDIVLPIIALTFAFGYFFVQILNVYNQIQINEIMSARLQDALMLILSYYFGSSFGADRKK